MEADRLLDGPPIGIGGRRPGATLMGELAQGLWESFAGRDTSQHPLAVAA
jgi:hypothetical protein